MNVQKRVKLIISTAFIIALALIAVVVFQLIKINIANQTIQKQQAQIEQYQNQLDNYGKTPNSDYEGILEDNKW